MMDNRWDSFKFVYFLGSNIVFYVVVENSIAVNTFRIEKLFDIEKTQHSIFLENIVEKIKNKELGLLMINPSYGCELTALCKGIDIF